MLVEGIGDDEDARPVGRAGQQGPDVDGVTYLAEGTDVRIGDVVRATVVATEGIDLVAEVR